MTAVRLGVLFVHSDFATVNRETITPPGGVSRRRSTDLGRAHKLTRRRIARTLEGVRLAVRTRH